MKKSEVKITSVILTAIAFATILFSGWIILSQKPVAASAMCKVTIECPDGRKLSCEGTTCGSNESDPKDPYCVGDDEITRCSDKEKETNINRDGKDRKKKDKKNNNSNISFANIAANENK